MQPTPPTPPSPPELPPPPSELVSQISVPAPVVEMVQIPVSSIPRTAEQLQGMRVRAQEIQNQLDRASEQRKEITEQLQGAPSEARPGLEQQLRVVDARIGALEQDLTNANRLVTAATPEAHAAWQEQEHAREARQDSDEEAEMFVLGGGLGILLALLAVAARRFFRRRRNGARPGGTASTADDPRIDRLGQAVDAIALEVERIGEGQRFVTQLLAEERDPRRLVGARPEDAIGQQRR